ncbi:MAG: hypothetical protein HY587_04975 [Candidatus Omnitrophica bacterium]|nr:hypothetical protein [Candidatus Omnitrophota bacterium]
MATHIVKRGFCPRKKLRINDEHGIILVTFYGILLLMTILLASLYAMSYGEIRASYTDSYITQAFYIAEAGIQQQLASLNSGGTTSMGTVNIGQGSASVTWDNVAKTIVSTGTLSGKDVSSTITVTVHQTNLSVNAIAALHAASNLTTNGNITVDGRDHDSNGNLTGDPGVYGVATTANSYTQSGSSQIGGNGAVPANPYDPVAVQLNALPFPPTPEEILGLQAGTLDAYKTSTPPSPNFSGIVYYTGDTWTPVDFGTFSSGILIVHNADADALMKNVHGNFNGVIITDKLSHLNGDMFVNGAIFVTTEDGNVIGNGSAILNYSSEVLANLTVPIYEITSWQDSHNG